MTKKIEKKKLTKTLQFFAAYLVAAWTLLQFIDWILIRYSISPYWVDLLLWVFIGIIPSLIIYLYNQERINRRVLKLREKIIFPLNILLIMVVTYFGFGTSDLGATTKEISYTNDEGELTTQTITKEEFRVGVPIFNFKQVTLDSTTLWMNNMVNHLVVLDLSQDKNIIAGAPSAESTTEKVQAASIHNDYYVDGDFEVIDSIYYITPIVRNSKNGKELHKQTFSGNDYLNVLDEVSIYIKEHVGIIEEMRDNYIDLNIKDFTTNSLKALEQYGNGNHEKATELDSTFAWAYFANAYWKIHYSQSTLEEQYIIDKAFEHRKKLPLQYQNLILIQRYIAYNYWEEAEALVKLQLEINPNDLLSIQRLYIIYSKTKNIDAFYEFTKSRYSKNPDSFNTNSYGEALLLKGDYDAFFKGLKILELQNPNNNTLFPYKTLPLLLSGNIDAASKNHEKTKLVHPDWTHSNNMFDEAIAYQKSTKGKSKDFSLFLGTYKNYGSEQTRNYFEYEDKLIMQGSNQDMEQALIAGENITSFPRSGEGVINRHEFQKNSKGDVYRIKSGQTSSPEEETSFSYFYKEDELIEKAYNLLKTNKLIDAENAFTEAIANNPEHWYLKDALAHITYVKSTDSLALKKQFERIVGKYATSRSGKKQGARLFWTENNKLYYTREGFQRMEIMPISETKYITTTRYSLKLDFEYLDDNKMGSFVWNYDIEKMEWVKHDEENNYLLKEE